MNSEDTSTPNQDPWDIALLGGAAASMYRSAPAPTPTPRVSQDVTSLFKTTAGIPKDITPPVAPTKPAPIIPVPQKESPIPPPTTIPVRPVPSPLSPLEILAAMPKKQASVAMPSVLPTPPPKAPRMVTMPQATPPSLAPAYPVKSPMRSLALHLLVMMLGVPLFAGGFYLADYVKSYVGKPNSAHVSESAKIKTATSTSPR